MNIASLPRGSALGWAEVLRRHLVLALAVVVFVFLAAQYVVTTPPFEIAEEPWHLRRIADVANKGFPAGHAAWVTAPPVASVLKQPPLYYWLAAVTIWPLDWQRDPSIYELNPHAQPAELRGVTDRNAFLARRAMAPGDPLWTSIILLRSLSVLAGAIGLVYARRVFLRLTANRWLASAALLLLACIPGVVFACSGLGPLALGMCLFLASVSHVFEILDAPGYPYALIRRGALLAGLTAMTVWWGWLAVVLLAACYGLRRSAWNEVRSPEHHGVRLMLALMGAMCLVWPAQLMFMGPISDEAPVWSRLAEMGIAGRLDVALRAFWGLFGWLNVPVGTAYYAAIGIILILGITGLALRLVHWYWRHPARRALSVQVGLRVQPALQLTIIWALLGLLVVAIQLLSPTSLYIGQAMFPIAALVVLVLVLGLDAWLRTYGVILLGAAVMVFGAASVASPRLYISQAYALPTRLTLPQLPWELRPLDVSYGDGLYLVGYVLGEREAEPGGAVECTLYWLCRQPISADYTAHVTVSGRDGDMVSSLFTRVGSSVFPTSMWLPGDVIPQQMLLPIDADAVTPSAGQLSLTVLDEATGEAVHPISPAGERLSAVLPVTRFRIGAVQALAVVPEQPLDVSLDGQVTLVGYDLVPARAIAGEPCELTLYWRAEGPLLYDYTVFVHLVDASGAMLAQRDAQPLDGDYPTGLWAMDEVVQDHHVLDIPQDIETGEYWLQVGMYRLDTGERLTISGTDPPLNYVQLGPIHVSGSG